MGPLEKQLSLIGRGAMREKNSFHSGHRTQGENVKKKTPMHTPEAYKREV